MQEDMPTEMAIFVLMIISWDSLDNAEMDSLAQE